MNPGNFSGHGFISPWIQAPSGLGQQINSPPQAFLVGFGAWNSPTVFLHPSMNLAANSPSLNPALHPSLNQSLNSPLNPSLNSSPHQFSQRFRPPLLEDNPPAPPLPPLTRRDDLWATGETSLPSSTRRDDLWAKGQLQLNPESSMPSQSQRMNVGPRKQPLLDDYYLDAAGPRPPPIPSPQPVPPPPPRIETVSISDLLYPPGRSLRPPKVLLIFRGVPGNGKTHVAKLIKEKEMELGGVAPRILSLDDYFMVENERDVKDPMTGRRSKEKCMDYEFDRALEDSYRKQMLKAFRKTVRFCFFRFFLY